jgi:hypothetical protein
VDADVTAVCDAVGRGDLASLRPLLHPYLHWTQHGVTTRGRTNVLARVAADPVADPPTSYELRDGQVYRWSVG